MAEPVQQYDNIDTIPLATLQQLMEVLKTARVSPQSLYAYAIALDCIDYAKEVSEAVDPEERMDMTPVEAMIEDRNAMLEDSRDDIIDLYDLGFACLSKMGYDVKGDD